MSEWTDSHPRYCKVCGATVGKNKHYCPECKPKKRSGAPHRMKEKVCQHCGKTFWTQHGSTKHCSAVCGRNANRPKSCQLYRGQGCRLVWTVCRVCGKPMIKHNGRRDCSDECKKEYYRAKRERDDAKRVNPRVVHCRECGATVEVEYGNKHRYFCSDLCCRRYTSRASNDRREARLKQAGFVESVGIKTIGKRDGWRCHICGKRVDAGLRAPHPMSATRDHLVPVSQQGEHSRRNVRLAHYECNSRRGVKGDVQLLLFG